MLLISALAIALAVVTGFVAEFLVHLIGFVTNIAFYGRISTAFVSPAGHHLGYFVVFVPVIGGIIVGIMARYGSKAIRGHGIPEAMEQVLLNESRIPPRITFLKPISAAISIGTGGPFGAEGPIIATGGALGSFIGQLLHTTAAERKTLLAAGAAAGMAATFGSPVSAVLLAIELLLFEFRARSVIPVALAAATGAAVRFTLAGMQPVFAMPAVGMTSPAALLSYVLLGLAVGVLSVGVTRAVYEIEDAFEHLPIHWMWWPAIGGVVVGVVGIFAPRTMGVGYDNIAGILGGSMPIKVLFYFMVLKFISWSVSLGSGTSGGTLAPLFTIGGAIGALAGLAATSMFPNAGIDPRVAALVGMAALFAGASRALMASVVFAFETTLQPHALMPLLAGCTAAYLISAILMKNTIMTEKLARRGVRVPSEYAADFLDQLLVSTFCKRDVVSFRADTPISELRDRMWTDRAMSHQGFPVVDAAGRLVGVVTRRDLLDPAHAAEKTVGSLITRAPSVIFPENTLRDAADHMVRDNVGRLPVVDPADPLRLVGIISRSDLLAAHERRLYELETTTRRGVESTA